PILSSRSFPRLWWWSLSVAHKRQRLKQWPIRPRSESPLIVSIYFASFRCKLHCPCKITRTTTFLSSPLDVFAGRLARKSHILQVLKTPNLELQIAEQQFF